MPVRRKQRKRGGTTEVTPSRSHHPGHTPGTVDQTPAPCNAFATELIHDESTDESSTSVTHHLPCETWEDLPDLNHSVSLYDTLHIPQAY